ncbi:lysozyme inhibitor LprI family protein [uncultured Thioclava sp.]|uniref:lysozyme inhibitor LprI family protein n=1 Tax=uncultured Thioclava sp. TaxID=473858 RepID=UPI0025E90F8E|nr:lysozyme inhibitor LprI family protein [uncultured Thioclava sp.]
MKQMMIAALLAALGSPALADPSVDPNTVHACFDGAKDTHPACIGDAANACQAQPGGATTLGISACLQGEAQVWDDILNAQYKGARAQLLEQGGTPLADQLLDAQRTWIAFRDADCGLVYSIWADGSIRTVIASSCYLNKTAQRALELHNLGNME